MGLSGEGASRGREAAACGAQTQTGQTGMEDGPAAVSLGPPWPELWEEGDPDLVWTRHVSVLIKEANELDRSNTQLGKHPQMSNT